MAYTTGPTVLPTTLPTNATNNSTSEVAALAHKAIDFVTGSTVGIVVGVIVLVLLIVIVVGIVYCACKGLKSAKEKALIKLKALQKSQEQALEMMDAVPDVNVASVQPSASRKQLKNLGRVRFSLRYEEESTELVVTVHECQELPVKYSGGTVYKYVEVEMFPFHRMTSHKPRTSYVRNDLSPVFEEEVRIKMTSDEVKDQKFYVHVCDFNQLSARDLIGSYHVNLQNTKVKNKDTKYEGELEWIESIRGAERGDINVMLRYYRGEGQLLVKIKELKSLKPALGRRFTSAYVKVHMVHGSKQLFQGKTKVQRKNFEPVYNKSFLIPVSQDIIEGVNLIIRVKDSPIVGRKRLLGEVCIGGDAVGSYLHQWKLTLEKVDQEIEMWHCLELLHIIPGKTNLATAMKAIQVFESSDEEEESSEDEGLFGGLIPDVNLPFGMGGLFGGSDAPDGKKKGSVRRKSVEL